MGVWHDDDGWGVIDSAEVPGGCWAHFSDVRMQGPRTLTSGDRVAFTWEVADQDGYAHRALAVWPDGVEPGSPAPPAAETDPTDATAYTSRLTMTFDDEP